MPVYKPVLWQFLVEVVQMDNYDPTGNGKKKKTDVNLDPHKVKSAMELTGLSPELMHKALKEASKAYDMNFNYSTFTPTGQNMLNMLKSKIVQNQPVQQAAPIQGLRSNNPFSLNLSGLSEGLNSMTRALVNNKHMQNLYGNPDKETELKNTAQQKLDKAQKLKQLAYHMEQGGSDSPSAMATVSQLRGEAQNLTDSAQKDLTSADQYKGLLPKYLELMKEKKTAEEQKQARDKFIKQYGLEAYKQAVGALRDQAKEAAITKRANIKADQKNKEANNPNKVWVETGLRLISEGNTKAGIQALKNAGYSDPQIASMVHDKSSSSNNPTFVEKQQWGKLKDEISQLQNNLRTLSNHPPTDKWKTDINGNPVYENGNPVPSDAYKNWEQQQEKMSTQLKLKNYIYSQAVNDPSILSKYFAHETMVNNGDMSWLNNGSNNSNASNQNNNQVKILTPDMLDQYINANKAAFDKAGLNRDQIIQRLESMGYKYSQ